MNNFFVGIIIEGKNPDLVINRLIKYKIKYYYYKKINYKKFYLKVNYSDYLKISKMFKIYNINVVKYYGSLKFIYFIYNNLSSIIIFLVCIMFIILLSNTCFEINIAHNNKKIRKLVKEELNYYGIKNYNLIPNYKKRSKIIKNILNNNKDKIEWMEIEKKGSKIIVKITERKHNKKNDDTEYRNIIAKKDGIIKKIEVSNGMILKKKNDYVTKGEIIVSGNILKDDEIKGQTSSKGKIYAEVWYVVNVEYPLYYKQINYLEDTNSNIIINVLSNKYSLKKIYKDSKLKNNNVLIYDNLFPFKVSLGMFRKTKVINQKLDSNKALNKALKKAESKIKSKLSKNEYIISKKNLKFTQYNSKIVVDIFFKVYEDITSYQPIDKIDISDN